MKVRRKCCYPTCTKHNLKDMDTSFFAWPNKAKSSALSQQWETFVLSRCSSFKIPTKTIQKFLCDKHFESYCYSTSPFTKTKRLLEGSIPTVHEPVQQNPNPEAKPSILSVDPMCSSTIPGDKVTNTGFVDIDRHSGSKYGIKLENVLVKAEVDDSELVTCREAEYVADTSLPEFELVSVKVEAEDSAEADVEGSCISGLIGESIPIFDTSIVAGPAFIRGILPWPPVPTEKNVQTNPDTSGLRSHCTCPDCSGCQCCTCQKAFNPLHGVKQPGANPKSVSVQTDLLKVGLKSVAPTKIAWRRASVLVKEPLGTKKKNVTISNDKKDNGCSDSDFSTESSSDDSDDIPKKKLKPGSEEPVKKIIRVYFSVEDD